MANYVKVTESLFLAIKSLLNAGATYPEVKKYYGVSDNTCKFIKRSENFKEYKQVIAAIAIRNAENRKVRKVTNTVEKPEAPAPVEKPETPAPTQQVVRHEQSITIQATHYMMQELQETNKLLKDISNKLAFIVEQLA